jgi:hypothetical protein
LEILHDNANGHEEKDKNLYWNTTPIHRLLFNGTLLVGWLLLFHSTLGRVLEDGIEK